MLPLGASGVDRDEELFGQSAFHLTGKIGALELLQQDVKQIEIGISEVQRRSFVAIEIKHGGWIVIALALQIKRIVA